MAFVITDGANYLPPEGFGTGLEIRDYDECPLGYNSSIFDLPLIDEDEWGDRLQEQIKAKAQLHNLRDIGMNGQRIPSMDQNGQGYCWSYSTGACMTLLRVLQGEPYVELSPHATAWIIKGGRNQGGFGSQSLDYVTRHGMPSSRTWPLRSMDGKRHNNAAMRQDAEKQKVTEWMDIPPRSKKHLVTCLLLNIPVVSDFNWWRHSVATMSLLSLRPFRTLIWNSWRDSWGENGTGVLEGDKAVPDGMICPRVITGA